MRLIALAFVTYFVTLFPEPVLAQQNVMVRPMRVEADVPANRTARVILNVTNQHATRTEMVTLSTVDLTQGRDGGLQVVDAEMRAELGEDGLVASSREWITLPAERLEVPPSSTVQIPVLIRVPFDAQGSYFSGVMLRTDAPPAPVGSGEAPELAFTISFGFMVPLVLGIQGRPVRQDISVSEVDLSFLPAQTDENDSQTSAQTRVSMEIANRGRTYSALRGEVVVEARAGGNWRTIARAALPNRRILPGLTLELGADIGRRLPSGEYRLIGNLFVDGRQLPRIERVVQFEGDPDADALAFETTLELDPPVLRIAGTPGASRTTTLEVGNPGDLPLTLEFSLETPQGLQGVAMGEIMGEDLSAAEWSDVRPGSMTIPPGQRRNVRVTTRLPREGLDYASYFADIVINASYPDGQNAGETRSSLRIRQEQVAAVPAGEIDRFNVSIGEDPSHYILQARMINTGNVEIAPQIFADLITGVGESARRWQLSGSTGEMLPLGMRDLSGLVDLSTIAPGDYTLLVVAENSGLRIAERQIAIRVQAEEGDDAAPRELIVQEE